MQRRHYIRCRILGASSLPDEVPRAAKVDLPGELEGSLALRPVHGLAPALGDRIREGRHIVGLAGDAVAEAQEVLGGLHAGPLCDVRIRLTRLQRAKGSEGFSRRREQGTRKTGRDWQRREDTAGKGPRRLSLLWGQVEIPPTESNGETPKTHSASFLIHEQYAKEGLCWAHGMCKHPAERHGNSTSGRERETMTDRQPHRERQSRSGGILGRRIRGGGGGGGGGQRRGGKERRTENG